MAADSIRILLAEPDMQWREDIRTVLEAQPDMSVTDATSKDEATSLCAEESIDCVIADAQLDDSTGFELFEAAREEQPGVACVLFTDRGIHEIDSSGFGELVPEYVSKDRPNATESLPDRVRGIVANRMQVGYPIPEEEQARLDALDRYDFSDLEAAETFDRISRLIRRHFDVATSFIGFMEAHEERFVACQGADWQTLDREDSVCTYAMLEDGLTVIENVQDDPRFEHNDRLRELGVRAYAGANLTTPDGEVIGEVCLIHDEPRGFDEELLVDLELFAEEIMEQLELRKRLNSEQSQS